MQLASRFASRSPVLRSEYPLSDDQIRAVAPSIFADAPHESRSERYSYIPTATVLQELRGEGFEPFMVCQTRVRQDDRRDYTTIRAMATWRTLFVVPLGVGAHLLRWGIPEARIRELDWWESARVGGLELVATPARHSSGRFSFGPRPLWAGFAVIGARHRVWYSGDSGFHATLTDIGERLGPFDLTLIDVGQYDADWPDAHLGPDLAVQAHRRVRGEAMLPVHWALIKQANHAWTEPVERVLAAARCHSVTVLTPRPGEGIEPTRAAPGLPWWPALPWNNADEAPVRATEAGSPSHRVHSDTCSGPPAAQTIAPHAGDRP